MKKILITGHRGLVGRYLSSVLKAKGFQVLGFDTADSSGDITDSARLAEAMQGCVGVVHLAAISRVVWGEKNPDRCWQTNAMASECLLSAAITSKPKPWVLVASSREVYGEACKLPVSENVPLAPVNIYGRSKAYMEEKTMAVREAGLNTGIVRLANVYGCPEDHHDRVLPAFSRLAAEGRPLRVDGFNHLFDFTHISDTVIGLTTYIEMLQSGEKNIPPIHLLPGVGTTLLEAAKLAISAANSDSKIIEAPSRSYDVSRFIGNPSRAKEILGWQASVLPKEGIGQLVKAFQNELEVEEVF